MKSLILTAALVSSGLAVAVSAPTAFAQDAMSPAIQNTTSQNTPPTATVPASPAQLKREHDRAVKAGDNANDPFDSSSSDSLNQQQLQGVPSQAAVPLQANGEASPDVLAPDETIPGNATVEAIPDDSQSQTAPAPGDTAGQPGSADGMSPSPDVSPPTTDEPLTPPNPVEPH